MDPPWLQKLIARELSCVPKSIVTRLLGDVFLAELGTGSVRAKACLTEARILTESELATEPIQHLITATGWPKVHGWFLTNVQTLDQPWTIPAEAHKTCAHWVPRRRWDVDSEAKTDDRRRKVVGKAWPKRFPKKCHSALRDFMPRPSCTRPKGTKREITAGKRSHANTPATCPERPLSRETATLPLAQRIATGRTAPRLQHLAEMHLFHAPRQLHEPPQPKAGIFANYNDDPVYIVTTWMDTRRKRLMADVLPLLPHGDNQYVAFRKRIVSCEAGQLCRVGERFLSMRRKNLCKGKFLFDAEVTPAEAAPSLSQGRICSHRRWECI